MNNKSNRIFFPVLKILSGRFIIFYYAVIITPLFYAVIIITPLFFLRRNFSVNNKIAVSSSPLTGFQASKRGGVVKVEFIPNSAGDRVTLTGDCITTIESQLLV